MNHMPEKERGPGGATPEAASMSDLTTTGSLTTVPHPADVPGVTTW